MSTKLLLRSDKGNEIAFWHEKTLHPHELWNLGVLCDLEGGEFWNVARRFSRQFESVGIGASADIEYTFKFPYDLINSVKVAFNQRALIPEVDVGHFVALLPTGKNTTVCLSDRDPDTYYEVTEFKVPSIWTCTCPAFKFGASRPCKHIKRLHE